MDPLFIMGIDNELVLLPQTLPVVKKTERFNKAKFESFECVARNCALGCGILMFCTPFENVIQAVVVDSGFNTSSFYCMLAAKLMRCDIEVHAISNSVNWMYDDSYIDQHTTFHSHCSIESTFLFEEIVPEIVFLDVCNCAHTILDDIFLTLDSMNRNGGVWGISFNGTRHVPTKTNLKRRKVELKFRPYNSNNETLREWMLAYCIDAGKRAQFYISLYWEDKNNGVITFLFRVAPYITKSHIFSSYGLINLFWSSPLLTPILLSNSGVLYRHLMFVLGKHEKYVTLMQTLESNMRHYVTTQLQTKSIQEVCALYLEL